jgi:flavorubredoxin
LIVVEYGGDGMNTKLRDGIHWVGYVDWTVRDFHGYRTESGSSYNAYLVQGEKTALIDTVKAPYAGDLLRHIQALTNLDNIDYVVCNHAEPDHAGSLPRVMEACRNAELVCDEKCRDALSAHVNTSGWTFKIVGTGDTVSLGKRTLTFLETPMVHWPESMFTYIPEDKLLFSMDAFGQHFASAKRFDDENPLDIVMSEAKTYYANIVMLYGKQIARVLEQAGDMPLKMVAPSHGVIWRSHIPEIVEAYRNWIVCRAEPKVLVLYDTMWQSTELMAKAILSGAAEYDVECKLINVRETHKTAIVTETLDAAAIAVGSPTLNMTLMPEMAATLTYLKGLRPLHKAGFAFGSYGWAAGGVRDVEAYLRDMKFDLLREPLTARFVPTQDVLEQCRESGRKLAQVALDRDA